MLLNLASYLISRPLVEDSLGFNVRTYIIMIQQRSIVQSLRRYLVMLIPKLIYYYDSLIYVTRKLDRFMDAYNEDSHTNESYISIIVAHTHDITRYVKQLRTIQIVMNPSTFLTHLPHDTINQLKPNLIYMYEIMDW